MSVSPQPPTRSVLPAVERILNRLTGVRTASRGWVACCPAHDDREPSLSIGLGEEGQVLLKCFAGCTMARIVETIGMTVADLFPDSPATFSPDAQASPVGTGRSPLSLLDLAQEKCLPWQFLFNLGVMDTDHGSIEIPYHLADGSLAPRQRIRTALAAKEGSYWSKGQGAIVPYGLERLAEARKAGYLVLVEGESDCWTLWYHHIPALGLPGAEMAGKLEEGMLAGIERLYVIQEPDAGGAAFVKQITRRLETRQWQGKAHIVALNGAKDPNALHQQDVQGVSRSVSAGSGTGRAALLLSLSTTGGHARCLRRTAATDDFQLAGLALLGVTTGPLGHPGHPAGRINAAGGQAQAGQKLAGAFDGPCHCRWRRGVGQTTRQTGGGAVSGTGR